MHGALWFGSWSVWRLRPPHGKRSLLLWGPVVADAWLELGRCASVAGPAALFYGKIGACIRATARS